MSTDVFVHKYTHLKNMPREKEALAILQKVASLVKPLMRKHGWHLPVLAEFFPENPGLLGLNINGGQKICIRLRPHFDKGAFMQEHDVIGTMLHELTHNVHGPHDQKFYSFLSKLEDEYDALRRSGYAGEGFFSQGIRLGQGVSHDVPPRITRERAAAAAERRRQLAGMLGGSRSLGGRPQGDKSLRQLAAEAAERRLRDQRTCASGEEAQVEADRAARDGVENDALSDEELEAMLATGAFEGGSERDLPITDLDLSRGQSSLSSRVTEYIRCMDCTFDNSIGSEACEVCGRKLQSGTRSQVITPKPFQKPPPPHKTLKMTQPRNNLTPSAVGRWTCGTCTLDNHVGALQCGACGSMQPAAAGEWICLICGEGSQDAQFWSCRVCGTIKASSAAN